MAPTADTIRVLHLLPHLEEVGNGTVDITVDLALAQAEAGLIVSVAAMGGQYVDLLTDAGVTHAPLRLTPKSTLAARRVIQETRPSVIHAHTLKGLALARLATTGLPTVVTMHRDDLGIYNNALRLADRIIAVSSGMVSYLRPFTGRCPITVVANGILGSPRRARLRRLAAETLDRPAFVFVGGLYRHKGVHVLLEAFHMTRKAVGSIDPQLYIIGDGPDRPDFERLAGDLRIAEQVHFLGFQADAYAYIKAADIFVLPSLREPFGLVLAEARDAGVAIIASREGGIPEVLEGGRAGRLVPPGNSGALASAMSKLIIEPAERERLARAARQNTDWLSSRRMADDVLSVYRDALGTR